jgi:hypothetical protein
MSESHMVSPVRERQAATMATGVSPEHTSVPRWAAQPPEVDGSGRRFLVLSCGEAAWSVAERWSEEITALGRPSWGCHFDEPPMGAGDEWLQPLRRHLERARVGTRLMVAGPELEVLDVIRTAHAAGAVDAELRCWVSEDELRRVQCPHCHAHTVARVAVGGTTDCAGCGRSLLVYHHVSRRHGAYLGFMADAEEPGR